MDFVGPLVNAIVLVGNSISTRIMYFVNLNEKLRFLADERDRYSRAEGSSMHKPSETPDYRRFAQSSHCFRKCSISCITRYRLSKKVQRKLKELNYLMGIGPLDVLVANGSIPKIVEELPTRPSIGLEPVLEKVRQLLDEEDVGIIGIYGMGGVGKTTLLKCIYNQLLRMSHDFDVVIWVVVSRDVNECLEQRTSNIYRVLRQKKFLLLLDDVWEGLELEKIGIALPSSEDKCKGVFTTRSMDVCSDMDAQRKIKVDFLKEEASRKLFHEKVGKSEIMNSPSINSHVETIIRKCGGLLLALVTVGRAMANKMTKEEWEDAIEALKKSPPELGGMGNVCSIEKEQLVEYWIGEGSNYGNADNKGHTMIGSLKVAYLLENGEEETQVKMHDVQHRISLLDNEITELSEIPSCSHLETLLLQWNRGLNKISDELGCLTNLRHLDLQWTCYLRNISREAITGLSHLRVLNVYYSYGCWEFRECESKNEFQPEDLENLKLLTSIGITVTKLTTLKKLSDFISLLKCTQFLNITECEGLHYLQLSSASSNAEKLRKLSISCCNDLKHLEIGPAAGKTWLSSLEVLALHSLPNMSQVWRNPLTQGCLQSLRSISIWYCHNLKNISWISILPKLETVYLFYCNEMEELISGDEVIEEEGSVTFPLLRTMSIWDLPKLRSISRKAMDFPFLERLAVIDCPGLKKLPLKASNASTLATVYGEQKWWDNLEWDEDAKSSPSPGQTRMQILPNFQSSFRA
ncbi:hypothetical protein NMG60_11029917 [Bertholletia excelsa]